MAAGGKREPLLGRGCPEGKAPMWSCTLSFATTMLGTGLLGMPWAIARCGYGLGLVLLVLSALGSVATLSMLSVLQIDHPGASFATLVARSGLPGPLQQLPDMTVLLMCMVGGQTSYLIVIGDALDTVATFAGRALPRRLCVVAVALLLGPLCLQRELHALRFASVLSILAYAAVSASVVARALLWKRQDPTAPDAEPGSQMAGAHGEASLLVAVAQAAPVFVFAFTCHMQLPVVALELRRRSAARLIGTAAGATALATVLYAAVGVSGYTVFGPGVHSDVLLEFRGAADGALASLALAVALGTSLPLWHHSARESAARLLRWAPAGNLDQRSLCGLSVAIMAPSILLALAVDDLGTVLGLVGGTGCAVVSLVLPGLLHLRLRPRRGRAPSAPTALADAAGVAAAAAALALGSVLVARTVLGPLLRR